jgi:hypothetical protein
MGRGLWTAQITLIICYQIELDKLNIYETLTCLSLECVVALHEIMHHFVSLSVSLLRCTIGCTRATSG